MIKLKWIIMTMECPKSTSHAVARSWRIALIIFICRNTPIINITSKTPPPTNKVVRSNSKEESILSDHIVYYRSQNKWIRSVICPIWFLSLVFFYKNLDFSTIVTMYFGDERNGWCYVLSWWEKWLCCWNILNTNLILLRDCFETYDIQCLSHYMG